VKGLEDEVLRLKEACITLYREKEKLERENGQLKGQLNMKDMAPQSSIEGPQSALGALGDELSRLNTFDTSPWSGIHIDPSLAPELGSTVSQGKLPEVPYHLSQPKIDERSGIKHPPPPPSSNRVSDDQAGIDFVLT
jgi:hypothetical protein